ncbi:MAG: thioredoxin domain-containing protein [Peptococcaceae bacterium]|nr:thioredoxin domain-containing protein [Peptococcaceae bacterium]
MINADKEANRLINEKSPYLLQHAYNPVDWYPWSDEAFQKAKEEDKPVFLSIGYSTCHWCHVMERESFEDQEVAELLNRSFIAVKVDREERPDIDHLYMAYCQAMTGSGGWPLTVIMTPDKQPFFAGTYFPKHSSYGRPGLMQVLEKVEEIWRDDKNKVLESAQELYENIAGRYYAEKQAKRETLKMNGQDWVVEKEGVFAWGPGVLRKAYALMEQNFDADFGGFGHAPKFPSPHNLGFLFRYHLEEPDSKALAIAEKTLKAMADGGIYDHIGFGFARYSTDRYWLVPHFEKMLYDNAGLAFVYLEAYQLTGNKRYARIADEVFQYILRDMTSAEGGFFSAEDADSEGVEGKYYVWDELEVRRILLREIRAIADEAGKPAELGEINPQVQAIIIKLAEKTVDIYCEAYGINEEGHYEGKNIPSRIFAVWEDLAKHYGLSMDELEQLLAYCNEVLFREREKRVRPAKDDKILVSWNGLMIAAMAKAAQVFRADEDLHTERETLLFAAEKAVDFIYSKMFKADGRLMARYRDGDTDFLGYLDDYAFLIYGLLELYTACGKGEYLQKALELQEQQERLFRDIKDGGYFFTGNDAEELLLRPKEVYDGAMPSGNSISAYNLARIWRLTGEQKWQDLAEQQFDSFQMTLQEYPLGYTAFLQAIQYYLRATEEIVLVGQHEAEDLIEMQKVIFKRFRPFTVVAYKTDETQFTVPRLKDYPLTGETAAYYCRDFACQEPVHKPEKLRALLEQNAATPSI